MSETGKALKFEEWFDTQVWLVGREHNAFQATKADMRIGWKARYAEIAAKDAEIADLKKRVAGLVEKWKSRSKGYEQPAHEEFNYEDGKMLAFNRCADDLAAALGEGEGR
jgi:hypothetical protein